MDKIIEEFIDTIKNATNRNFLTGFGSYIVNRISKFLDDQKTIDYYNKIKREISPVPEFQIAAMNKRVAMMMPINMLDREFAYKPIILDVFEGLLDRFYFYKKNKIFELYINKSIPNNLTVDEQINIQNSFLDLYALLDKMLFNIYAIKYNLYLFDEKGNKNLSFTGPTLINNAFYFPPVKGLHEDVKRFQNMSKNDKTDYIFYFGDGRQLIGTIKETYLFQNDSKILSSIRNNMVHNEIRCDKTRLHINLPPNPHPIAIYMCYFDALLFEIMQLFKIMYDIVISDEIKQGKRKLIY